MILLKAKEPLGACSYGIAWQDIPSSEEKYVPVSYGRCYLAFQDEISQKRIGAQSKHCISSRQPGWRVHMENFHPAYL